MDEYAEIKKTYTSAPEFAIVRGDIVKLLDKDVSCDVDGNAILPDVAYEITPEGLVRFNG